MFVMPTADLQASEYVYKNSEQSNPKPNRWPSRLWRNIMTGVDDLGYSLTQVVFDNIDDFEQNVFDEKKARMRVKVKREVFDNQDVLNSFSVLDYFRVRIDSKDLSVSMPLFTPNITLGFSVGVGGMMEWTNIRQVTANKYAVLPTVNEEYKDLDYLSYSKKELRKIYRRRHSKAKKAARAQRKNAKENGQLIVHDTTEDPGGSTQQLDTYGGEVFLILASDLGQVSYGTSLPFPLSYL